MTKELTMLASGLFEVEPDGSIWRIAKRHGRGVRLGGGYHTGAGISPCQRVRAEYPQRQGYLLVAVTICGVKTVSGAHRIVWTNFHGAIPGGLTVNHKNGVKSDNSPDNLELATMSEQRIHAIYVLNVNRSRPKGSKHPKTKLTESDVLQIRQMRKNGVKNIEIANAYGMTTKAISAICTRRTWLHI